MFKVGELVQLLPEYARQVEAGLYADTPVEPCIIREVTLKYGTEGAIDVGDGITPIWRWHDHFRLAEGPW